VRKPEYANLKNKEDFIALKKQNVELTMDVWHKKFVYVGDTSIKVFEMNEDLLLYPIIIIECTFLYDDEPIQDKVEQDGHIVWKDLKPFVLKHTEITWVLIHFSCRYEESEIIDFFQKEEKNILSLSSESGKSEPTDVPLKNVVLWACHRTDGTRKFQA